MFFLSFFLLSFFFSFFFPLFSSSILRSPFVSCLTDTNYPSPLERLFFAMDNFPKATSTVIILSIIYCISASVFYSTSQTWASCYVDTSTVALFVCLHPLATALFSTFLLNRELTPYDVVGGFIVLGTFSFFLLFFFRVVAYCAFLSLFSLFFFLFFFLPQVHLSWRQKEFKPPTP